MMNTAVRSLFAFIIPVRQVDKRYVKLNSEWRKSMNTQEKTYNNAVNSCRTAIYKSSMNNQGKVMRTAGNIFKKYSVGNEETKTQNEADTATIGLHLKEAVDSIFDPTTGMTEEQKKKFVEKLYRKLESGKKLTADEMQYLRMNDPVTYAKAARVQTMREAFKKQLENAKSKEEASDMYLTNMSRIGEDDPAKKELQAAYEDVYSEFRKMNAYKKLPDTRKEAMEEKDSCKKHDCNNVKWEEDESDRQEVSWKETKIK